MELNQSAISTNSSLTELTIQYQHFPIQLFDHITSTSYILILILFDEEEHKIIF